MVSTNNLISQPFGLSRGTRQGSPISPLLFIIGMEPLAIGIRSHSSIHGIKIEGMEHNTAMYADDTIVFLSHLAEQIPSLLELISQFGNFSGFKVNKEKSSIMFLNESERKRPIRPHPFVNATEGFKYLGIRITPKICPSTFFFSLRPGSFSLTLFGTIGNLDSDFLFYIYRMIGEGYRCRTLNGITRRPS